MKKSKKEEKKEKKYGNLNSQECIGQYEWEQMRLK